MLSDFFRDVRFACAPESRYSSAEVFKKDPMTQYLPDFVTEAILT